jgi:hypothetical protein
MRLVRARACARRVRIWVGHAKSSDDQEKALNVWTTDHPRARLGLQLHQA